jgi:hypothetical protein
MGWTNFIGPIIVCVVAVMKVINDRKNKRSLDWFSWILIILAIGYMGVEIYNTLARGTKAEENQQAVISATTQARDTLSNKVDSTREKINKHADDNRDSIIRAEKKSNDSLKAELTKKGTPAVIDALKIPYYINETGDSLNLVLALRNYGGKIATNVILTSLEVVMIDGKFSVLSDPLPPAGDDILAPNADISFFKPVLKSRVRPNRKLYWHLI